VVKAFIQAHFPSWQNILYCEQLTLKKQESKLALVLSGGGSKAQGTMGSVCFYIACFVIYDTYFVY
jgi:hypothetical protein